MGRGEGGDNWRRWDPAERRDRKAGPGPGPARRDGRREGRTDTHKSVRPPLATDHLAQLRSLARTQRKRNRNRFPGSGGIGAPNLRCPKYAVSGFLEAYEVVDRPIGGWGAPMPPGPAKKVATPKSANFRKFRVTVS